jgi:hypothetical protein
MILEEVEKSKDKIELENNSFLKTFVETEINSKYLFGK